MYVFFSYPVLASSIKWHASFVNLKALLKSHFTVALSENAFIYQITCINTIALRFFVEQFASVKISQFNSVTVYNFIQLFFNFF